MCRPQKDPLRLLSAEERDRFMYVANQAFAAPNVTTALFSCCERAGDGGIAANSAGLLFLRMVRISLAHWSHLCVVQGFERLPAPRWVVPRDASGFVFLG